MLKNERNTKTIMPQWIERDCDLTWKKMADDREVLRELWDGRLPIRFSLAPDEVISMEQPDPIYLMVPRQVECWITISILIPTWNDLSICIIIILSFLFFPYRLIFLSSKRKSSVILWKMWKKSWSTKFGWNTKASRSSGITQSAFSMISSLKIRSFRGIWLCIFRLVCRLV